MKNTVIFTLLMFGLTVPCLSQQAPDRDAALFKVALPSHPGRLEWRAEGFQIIQASAKPNGVEIGLRGRDASGRLTFLGFLFVIPGKSELTSANCRDQALAFLNKDNSTVKTVSTSEIPNPGGLPVELVSYFAKADSGKVIHSTRAFTATGDICGDLEFYSDAAFTPEDPVLKGVFESFRLDPTYSSTFNDAFIYAQILNKHRAYKAAAPIFEQALGQLGDGKDAQTERRVTTDQAGMAYGISGDITKAREIFTAAIAKDPDYPFYYYNLACADAEEGKLQEARNHLHQAFDRKANAIHGETMPDPTTDDSFLRYKGNKEFWEFIKSLH